MKVIATICQVNTTDGVTPIAVSPKDDVFFVPLEAAPTEMLTEAKAFLPDDIGTVLGFVLVAEGFKP